jgi:hypothetical protein
MGKNPLNKGIIMENAAGIGTVTSEMVEARARELAAINGRRLSGNTGSTPGAFELIRQSPKSGTKIGLIGLKMEPRGLTTDSGVRRAPIAAVYFW